MHAADDQRAHAFRGLIGHAEADPAPHRIAPVVGSLDSECVEHSHDVADVVAKLVRRLIVRFVACAIAARVHQNDAVAGFEYLDVSCCPPTV